MTMHYLPYHILKTNGKHKST